MSRSRRPDIFLIKSPIRLARMGIPFERFSCCHALISLWFEMAAIISVFFLLSIQHRRSLLRSSLANVPSNPNATMVWYIPFHNCIWIGIDSLSVNVLSYLLI